MSKTWFISDTHFGHTNVIQYCGRPFQSVEEMDQAMIDNWNKSVKPEDLIYHLGDFCMGDKKTVKSYTEKLNGRKFLIAGNHDRYKPSEYMYLGWEWCSRFPIIMNGGFLILSHEPIFLGASSPQAQLYGHLHDKTYQSTTGNYFNCCVERIGYAPISLDEIIKHYSKIGFSPELPEEEIS